jgi:hypothetical protein
MSDPQTSGVLPKAGEDLLENVDLCLKNLLNSHLQAFESKMSNILESALRDFEKRLGDLVSCKMKYMTDHVGQTLLKHDSS